MVEITIAYRGELRCDAVHGPSASQLETDAPKDNHGKGERFSPTDLVATALGSCMLTVMGITAHKMGVSIDGSSLRVEKEMSGTLPRRIVRLPVRVDMAGDCPGEKRKLLEQAALTCPVFLSVHPDIEKPVTFNWPS